MLIKKFNELLLKPVAKLCRQNMEFDIMPDFLLKEKTFEDPDYNEDITLVAFKNENDLPVGFIQGVIKERETEKIGYIKLLVVDSNYRREGIASHLFKIVEDYFLKKGIKTIRVYESYPNYFMPGVDPFYTEAVAFFERIGFKKFNDTSNLIADLSLQDFNTSKEEESLKKENIICSRAAADDKKEIFEWLESLPHFKAWKHEVSSCFENNPISLHITRMNGKVNAFSAYDANNKGTGWFGPMGTDDTARGKGIGGVLLKRCLADMKKMGYNKGIIPWVGPIPFYMHYSNARVQRVFWRYEKKWN